MLALLPVSALLTICRADPGPAVQHHPGSIYCANGGYCVPNVLCAPDYMRNLYQPGAACYLAHGTPGICCLERKSSYKKRGFLKKSPIPKGSVPDFEFDEFTLNHAAKVGKFNVEWLKDFEEHIAKSQVFVRKGSAAFNHFAIFKSKPKARQLADTVSTSILGAQDLAKRFGLSPNQAGFGLGAYPLKGTILGNSCPTPEQCNRNYPYRMYNGTCNNLKNSLWGSASTAVQRTLLPEYSDGIWEPKVAKSGNLLPSARLVSTKIVPDANKPSELDTHNVMQWGQFTDHDITSTPLFRLGDSNSSGIQCCTESGSETVSELVSHPRCLPIDIPANDPFYKRYKQRCMNFVRSLPGPQESCSFGYAEQQNQITHFHDASQVYGSDEEDALKLRTGKGGLMKTYKTRGGKELLPQEEGRVESDECSIEVGKQKAQDKKCFKAGDSRSNEQPGLTAFHTVWLREHNRLAKELHYFNPHWNDERLYQEARRILIAEMQHITYNEWLPIVLGTDFMEELDILPLTEGYNTRYNPKINPSILNSFSSAAFRFGHSLIQGLMELVKDVTFTRKKVKALTLNKQFLNPELLYTPGNLDKFLVGLATQASQKFDNVFSEQVTNHLLQPKDKPFGLDLVALNVQRGRDHGLQGYNAFRELCGLGRAKSFDRLTNLIPRNIVEKMKEVYESVDDVDLFMGGISETPAPGSIVGPTFQCIIGDQFKRLQHGDRFYYDSNASPKPFSEAQLNEVRKASLARITCDNGDNINSIQPLAFRKPSALNVKDDSHEFHLQEGYEQIKLTGPGYGGYGGRSSLPLSQSQTYFPLHFQSTSDEHYRSRRHRYSSSRSTPNIHRGVHSPFHQFQLKVNYGWPQRN